MSFIDGLVRSAVNPVNLAQLAMGPAGWASFVVRTMATAIGKELIQSLGQQLGVPQNFIDLAKNGLGAATGSLGGPDTINGAVRDIAQRMGLSPAEQGNLGRQMREVLNDLISKIGESEEFKEAKAGGKGAKGGAQGWLRAMASVLGEKLNVLAKEINSLAGQITKETPDKTALFGAATQEFGILMNATSNGIKTIGEGLANTARKN